ncbi:MAG: sugar phosphate isomerase/epimerase [Acidobacteria bacterium]|nr:MAG: sugar phosphate isomerase/epimerase [Acidobacteriota bacterium]
MDRRQAITQLTALLLTSSARNSTPLVTEASRGQTGGGLERIGLALYTVREPLAQNFEETLAQIAAIGYQEVEGAFNWHGRAPEHVRRTLEENQLRAVSQVLLPKQIQEEWPKSLEEAATIGLEYVGCVGAYPLEEWARSLDDYRRLADMLNRAGEVSSKVGVKVFYHFHDVEFVPLEGRAPFDVLVEELDSAVVDLEMDLFWMIRAGKEPIEFLRAYPGRFTMFHVKDMDRSQPEPRSTEVGRGVIDSQRIWPEVLRLGGGHFFVEQEDGLEDPIQSVRLSYDYLSSLRIE